MEIHRVTYRLLMFPQRRMDDTTVEQNLGGIGDVGEHLERLVILLVVVMLEGLNPGLDFLVAGCGSACCIGGIRMCRRGRTCFNDIAARAPGTPKVYLWVLNTGGGKSDRPCGNSLGPNRRHRLDGGWEVCTQRSSRWKRSHWRGMHDLCVRLSQKPSV